MSSHHIVREKQEPALLVIGLGDFPDELLGQLLEWSPTVITTPQTAEKLVAYGIKIDWIISDVIDVVFQSDVKLMSCGGQNLTDAAFKFLLENEYNAVNIITETFKPDDYSHFAGNIDLVVFQGYRKIFPVVSGFSKWKPAGDLIEILGRATHADFRGLTLIGQNRYLTDHDGLVTLYFNEAFLFIAEEL